MDVISNFAHVCNGAAIAYFFMQARVLRKMPGDSYLLKKLSMVLYFWLGLHLKDLVFINDTLWNDVYFSGIANTLDMLLVPVMFIFFLDCIRPDYLDNLKRAGLLSVHVLFVFLYLFFPSQLLLKLDIVYSFITSTVAVFFVVRESKRKERHIAENYSYNEVISSVWIVKSLLALLLFLLVYAIFFWEETWAGDSIFYLTSILVWVYICREALRHESLKEYSGRPTEENDDPSAEKIPAEEDEHLQQLQLRLDQLMETEKPYLNPHLNISELAQIMGTNRTYLSQCINKLKAQTFYDYINDLRFSYACQLIKVSDQNAGTSRYSNEKNLSLKEISERSGFNSISTFNRQFSTKVGMSPSQYRTRQLKEMSPR